jgi:putative ABC transport system ATP-binding protein
MTSTLAAPDGDAAAIRVTDLVFGWRPNETTLVLPRFSLARGEKLLLKGPSGSGKSTLLGVLCGVLSARSGTVDVLGRRLSGMSGARRDALRAEHVGVIFQMLNLLPYLPVLGNVLLPCSFSRARRRRAQGQDGDVDPEARRLLARLGIDGHLVSAAARDLSVGQQQRVAAARALIGGPELVIADEPTSALDAESRDAFLALLIEEVAAAGASLLLVSHDAALEPLFDRVLDLADVNRADPSPLVGRAA